MRVQSAKSNPKPSLTQKKPAKVSQPLVQTCNTPHSACNDVAPTPQPSMPSGNTLGESTETPGDMIIEENVEMDDTETESFEEDSESEIRINRNNLGNFRKLENSRSEARFKPRNLDAFLAMPN